jgi:hypothetical protein
MKAYEKLSAIQSMISPGEFSSPVTSRMSDAISGEGSRHEENSWTLFPEFSWAAKKALQFALVVNKGDRKDINVKLALLEISKMLHLLQANEILAIQTALDHGVIGLRGLRPIIKALNTRKR